jgi:response regulator NasT
VPRVLAISECGGQAGRLRRALLEHGHELLAAGMLSEPWLERVETLQPDLVVLYVVLPDARLLDQIRTVNSRWPRPVVLFSDQGDSDVVVAAVDAGVHAYIVDGFDGRRLGSILDVAVARFRVYQTLRDELDRTRSSLRERKLVDRAKGILMNKRRWSEEQAYQALRKMAMDQNRRLADVAERLIEMSDLFE